MFSVGQHSVRVDPMYLRWLLHSTTAPSSVTAGIGLPGALLSRVHHNGCAFSGLMRDRGPWHYWDTLPSTCCTAPAASWECLDVLYMSPFRFRSARPLVKILKRTGDSGNHFGTSIVSWWRAELQFPVAYPLFFPRALPQSTGQVLGCLQIAWAGPSAGWTGFCCMHHRDRLPQPLLLISSGIIRSRHMQTQLHFVMFSKGIVTESADFMTWPFRTLSLS